MEKAELMWTGADRFESLEQIPGGEKNPREIMLYAFALCSGKVLAGLLNKSRVNFVRMFVEVEGELSDPDNMMQSTFTEFRQIIRLETDTDESSIESDRENARIVRAAHMMHDRYCPMSVMMQKIAPVMLMVRKNGYPLEVYDDLLDMIPDYSEEPEYAGAY